MVDDAVIADMVGSDALRRGREYATDGGVLSVQTVERNGVVTLFGSVQGRAMGPYTVVVTFFAPERNLGFAGSCTCPVRADCKHVAAVVLADDMARAVRGDPGRTRGEWARALQGVLPLGPAPAAVAEPSIGLQFELTVDQRKGAQLILRPVSRGSSGRWGRTGISWTSLAYHRARHAVAAVRLLEEMYALNARRDRYHHYGREEQVLLNAFPTGRVWDILAQAGEAGLALVRSGRAEEPILLAAEPGRVSIDLSETGSEWRLRPVVTAGPEALDPAQALLLGDPAHGVAWWRPGGEHGAGPLHLARLDREVPPALRDLVARGRDLVVPAAEQTEFLRDYYPAMRRQVTLTSADGSVELPTPRPPRLALLLEYAPGHRVTVRWSWRYAVGDAVREVPLWQPQHVPDPDRDADAEAKILQEVAGHTDALAALSESGALAARTELAGADALIGLAGVLTGIRGLADVEVKSVGEVLELRPAAGPPIVSVGGRGEGTDWFDLEVSVSVDGEDLPFADLFSALALDEGFLILPSGAYVSLDRPELHQLKALIEEARALGERRDGSVRLSRYQAGLWQELTQIGVVADQAEAWTASVRALAGFAGRLRAVPDPDAPPVAAVPEAALPAGLVGTLRPYQVTGFSWLAFLYDHGLGGVLADDMGLGKTLQAIALICRTREAATAGARPPGPPFLVVAPTSVVGNWVAEVRRFAPGLTVSAVSETVGRRGAPLWAVAARADVVVTSYTLLRLEYDDYAALGWAGLILDEAQALKNHAGKGHQCVKRLPVPFKLAITGTPMENNLTELWAMFSLVAPGLFPDVQRFGEYYRKPIERGIDPERLAQLRRRIRPLMLRRTKDEVAADLPPKVEQVISLELNPRHRRIYDTYLARERQKVLGLLGDMERHRIAILTSLTLLRQAALDIALVDPEQAGVPSTKLDALSAQVNEIVAEGHRVLVFSQFTRFLARVRERLDRTGIPYCYLDGRTRNRAAVVEAFTSGEAPVFLMSIKAGGVGLNLTQADYCILLDPWWNPATEAQAVDRAHRIGQTRTVMVYRLVAKDTIEEKVMALKESKAKLFSAIMDGGGAGTGSLTADDIRALLDG